MLYGDLEEAICHHALYFAIWKKYGCLPERYNWKLNAPDVKFYPLRPEFIESTYLLVSTTCYQSTVDKKENFSAIQILREINFGDFSSQKGRYSASTADFFSFLQYQATKNPFYLHVGKEILTSLNKLTRATCGYGTVHDVETQTLEDRQESFFLSETCKYLYLLFDTDNPINTMSERYVFTTEGHVFPVLDQFRTNVWDLQDEDLSIPRNSSTRNQKNQNQNCDFYQQESVQLPLKDHYLSQIFSQVGAELS